MKTYKASLFNWIYAIQLYAEQNVCICMHTFCFYHKGQRGYGRLDSVGIELGGRLTAKRLTKMKGDLAYLTISANGEILQMCGIVIFLRLNRQCY